MTDHDFDLFWKWLTVTKSSPKVKHKVESINIRRVFTTLGMFKSELEVVQFMRTWDCENEHTLQPPELKAGIEKLAPSQDEVFGRFLSALKKKDHDDKEEEMERQKQLELKEKKREQQKQARAIRQERNRARQYFFGNLLMKRAQGYRFGGVPEDDNNEVEEDMNTERNATEIINSFKDKYGLDQEKRKRSITQRISRYFRSFSRSSSNYDDRKVLPMISSSARTVPSHSPVSTYSTRSCIACIGGSDNDGSDNDNEFETSLRSQLFSSKNTPQRLEIEDSLVSFASSSYFESEFDESYAAD